MAAHLTGAVCLSSERSTELTFLARPGLANDEKICQMKGRMMSLLWPIPLRSPHPQHLQDEAWLLCKTADSSHGLSDSTSCAGNFTVLELAQQLGKPTVQKEREPRVLIY